MERLELEALLGQTATLGVDTVLQALLLAFVLGLLVAATYRWSLPGRVVAPSLAGSLVLLPMVSALVLMVIGNSLARAFSLVGALAIVRFRTRLKSTWDITFIFLSLAVGIACGVGALQVAAVGTGVIVLAVAVLGALPGTRASSDLHVLRCDVAAHELGAGQLEPTIARFARRHWLASVRTLRFGETMSLSYRLVLKRGATLEPLVRELSVMEGVERVTVLSENDEGTESE